jgi:hypothetical protein
MDITSEYTFPIFISSTEYNLKDLRAELASFLAESGYKPILSSAEGFPDSSPNLEPWESCIPVLESSFVMILIVDGRYGNALPWPNYNEDMGNRSVSPTHGEFLFSHAKSKRMFVFIRTEVLVHYQTYFNAIEKYGNVESKKILNDILPKNIDFETLEFVHEIKNKRPVSWITQFNDITDIKKEVKKKLLNQLSEIFLIKELHIETLIRSLNRVMNTTDKDEQKIILNRLDATKDFVESIEKISDYKREIDELKDTNNALKDMKTEEKKKSEIRINELNEKISKLEADSLKSTKDNLFIKDGKIQIGNPNYLDQNSLSKYGLGISPTNSLYFTGGRLNTLSGLETPSIFSYTNLITCANCFKSQFPSINTHSLFYATNDFKKCPECNKYYCSACWHKSIQFVPDKIVEKCPTCMKKVGMI